MTEQAARLKADYIARHTSDMPWVYRQAFEVWVNHRPRGDIDCAGAFRAGITPDLKGKLWRP